MDFHAQNVHRLSTIVRHEERFLLSDFDEILHSICVWDEFEMMKSVSLLKQALEGEIFVVEQKGKQPRQIVSRFFRFSNS